MCRSSAHVKQLFSRTYDGIFRAARECPCVAGNSLGADLQVWIVPEPGGSRYHLCALHTAARDLPTVMAYPSTAEAVDRLQADRRREAQQIAARERDACIAFVVCDRGDRYLSTGVFPV